MSEPTDLKLYVVRNQAGHYFRAKGFGGHGLSWVPDINKARIYGKIGPARGTITWFNNNHGDKPTPIILELQVSAVQVIDESDRVAKTKAKHEAKELRAEALRLQYQREQIKHDQKRLNEQKKRLGIK